MFRRFNIFAGLLSLCIAIPLYSQDTFSQRFIAAAHKASPSVVSIQVFTLDNAQYKKVGYASGTILSPNGYIVTNYHVVTKGSIYQINLFDGTECQVVPFPEGTLYRFDEKTDIAVLRIQHPDNIAFQALEFEDEKIYPGQWVIAIGNPFGLQQSITSGIISSIGRSDIGFADIEDFIQTDVPINPGNSGGPLISLNGKLIGINTAIRTQTGGYQGISFAIPHTIVKQVVSDLIQYGRVRRGWLGFLVQETTLKGGLTHYVSVISVIDGSPAALAGITSGDIIRMADGKPIKKISDLMKVINSKQIGSSLELVVARNGQLLSFEFVLQEKPILRGESNILSLIKSNYGITIEQSIQGVVITEIQQFGAAYTLLKKGDIIKSINNTPVHSLRDCILVLKKSNGIINTCTVLRGGKQLRCDFDTTKTD